MKVLLDAVNQLVRDQHMSKIESLAVRVKGDGIRIREPAAEYFHTTKANQLWALINDEVKALNLTGDFLAGLLIGAAAGADAEKNSERIDLVWSGPSLNFVPVRRSEQVLEELIDSANHSLYLYSYVLYRVPGVQDAIERALNRGVAVSMLIETAKHDRSDEFSKTADKLRSEHPRMKLYEWPIEMRDSSTSFASMHAKCFAADGARAFITSANLTSAALDRNMEAGVFVHGGKIPGQIQQQFDAMVAAKIITLY